MVSAREEGPVLRFLILTQRIVGPRQGTHRWLARSVNTGDVAHGRTEDLAVALLMLGIRALIEDASQHGQTPQAWCERATASEGQFVREFERMEAEGLVESFASRSAAGCRIEGERARLPELV